MIFPGCSSEQVFKHFLRTELSLFELHYFSVRDLGK